MRILIIEDEIPAYKKLLLCIDKFIEDAQILGWAQSIEEAKAFKDRKEEVDLIFSDIQLLDGLSFNIFKEVNFNCPIIFCTAFDQYLFDAFQSNGIAYLLKPYTDENFSEAIEKYNKLFPEVKAEKLNKEVFEQLKFLVENKSISFKQRFSVKKKNGIKLLNCEEIISFEAAGDFSFAYDHKGSKHVINYSLGDIERKTDPSVFFRINRSEIVNINYIESIEPHFKNRLLIHLKNKKESLYTSSGKTPHFRIWLEK